MPRVSTALPQLLLFVMLLAQLAVAQQCGEYQFDTPFFPGTSCEDIYNKNPQTRDMSGYYWILDGPSKVYCGMNYTGPTCEDIYLNNEATRDRPGYYRINSNGWVFCDMNAIQILFSGGALISSCAGVSGIWRRIANFDIAAGDDCPSPWIKGSYKTVSYCINNSTAAGCYSVKYSTNGINYQGVCGKASAYQKGTPDGFYNKHLSIDSSYVDGLSITHGNPHQHIWTYAVGVSASGNYLNHNCPCASPSGPNPPDYVGSHYYCESGTGSSIELSDYYLSDILWDGAGCPNGNTCCSDSGLPWFYNHLNQKSEDDIEVRVCTDQAFDDEAILITNLELYIQ